MLRQSARLATQRHASTLVLAEHDNNKLSPVRITTSAVAEDDPSISQSVFTITEKASTTHLSPGVSLIYDLAHDSGMLQSESQ